MSPNVSTETKLISSGSDLCYRSEQEDTIKYTSSTIASSVAPCACCDLLPDYVLCLNPAQEPYDNPTWSFTSKSPSSPPQLRTSGSQSVRPAGSPSSPYQWKSSRRLEELHVTACKNKAAKPPRTSNDAVKTSPFSIPASSFLTLP